MFKIDLVPANGGVSWDDCGRGEVAAILVSYSPYCVNSLRFLYFKDGELQFSEDHGKLSDSIRMIRLDYPTEVLIEVHGFRRFTYVSCGGLSSITFVTNRATYGPFGENRAPSSSNDSIFKFRLGSEADSINGFHGTVDRYGRLESLGVYLQTTISATRPDLKRICL
ncbi:unnamed protein product [Cuscuta epithymum]|uniref:Jacalin-type lectin domain-containing protein n=1 Tax=Cuscuta epithymum TaxID=186058 RepID=A0AAV0E180_9ASTE|nr:unnamed protein product [Cuscuta epithymum]